MGQLAHQLLADGRFANAIWAADEQEVLHDGRFLKRRGLFRSYQHFTANESLGEKLVQIQRVNIATEGGEFPGNNRKRAEYCIRLVDQHGRVSGPMKAVSEFLF